MQPEQHKQAPPQSAQQRQQLHSARKLQPEQLPAQRVKRAQPEQPDSRAEQSQQQKDKVVPQGELPDGEKAIQPRPKQKRTKTAAKASALKVADEPGSKREASPGKTPRPSKILAAKTMPKPGEPKPAERSEEPSMEAMAAGYAALAAAYFEAAQQEKEEAEAAIFQFCHACVRYEAVRRPSTTRRRCLPSSLWLPKTEHQPEACWRHQRKQRLCRCQQLSPMNILRTCMHGLPLPLRHMRCHPHRFSQRQD